MFLREYEIKTRVFVSTIRSPTGSCTNILPSVLDARVVELAVIHHRSSPLTLANADASAEIMHNAAQLLEQLAFLSADHGNQLFVTDLATPLPAFRQWRERPSIAMSRRA